MRFGNRAFGTKQETIEGGIGKRGLIQRRKAGIGSLCTMVERNAADVGRSEEEYKSQRVEVCHPFRL